MFILSKNQRDFSAKGRETQEKRHENEYKLLKLQLKRRESMYIKTNVVFSHMKFTA